MMTASNPIQAMLKTIKANPAIADIPWAQAAIDALESGDAEQEQQVANNLMETFGTNKEEVMAQAKKILHLP